MALTAPFRGGLLVGNTLYAAWDGELYTVNVSGERELFGTLSGSDKIFIARNNAATPNVVIVSNATAYELSGASVISYSLSLIHI